MIRASVAVAVAVALACVSPVARADDEPPRAIPPEYGAPPPPPPGVRPAPAVYTYEPLPVPPPLAHSGFQLAVRTGLSFPIGLAQDRDPIDSAIPGAQPKLSDIVGGQIPLIFDVGGKPNPYLFIGAYASFAVGLSSGQIATACNNARLDCFGTNFRVGAQVQYNIAPYDRFNPWLGYGLGFAWLTSGDDGQETSYRGFDFGHFMGGLDIRVSKTLGVGPYFDYTVGKYSHRRVESAAANVILDEDIQGRSFHYWLTIGPRFVFLP